MDYPTLIAPKGTAGSIASWVNYSKLDIETILDEAQALLYQQLRVREMRNQYWALLKKGSCHIDLPSDYLDPIGDILLPTLNVRLRQRDQGFFDNIRVYSQTSGLFGTDPFTTTQGQSTVSVYLPGHCMTQDTMFTISGATTVNGINMNGTFPIVQIVDDNNFFVDTETTVSGGPASASGVGGGSSATYAADVLSQGTPLWWAVWNETIHLDVALSDQSSMILSYYRRFPLLSNSTPTNFLTDRYPTLLRTACQAASADFMKDDTEYQKAGQRLSALVDAVNVKDDLALRGSELVTETP